MPNYTVEGLKQLVDSLPELERRVVDNLGRGEKWVWEVLPDFKKQEIIAEERAKHIELLREGATAVLRGAQERVESAQKRYEREQAGYTNTVDWAKAQVWQERAKTIGATARSWDELALRVQEARNDREALEALQNIALPAMEARAQHTDSPLRAKSADQVDIRRAIQNHLWAKMPSAVKDAFGQFQLARQDVEALRTELGTLSVQAGGLAEYRQGGPLGDLLNPQVGLLDGVTLPAGVEVQPADTSIFAGGGVIMPRGYS